MSMTVSASALAPHWKGIETIKSRTIVLLIFVGMTAGYVGAQTVTGSQLQAVSSGGSSGVAGEIDSINTSKTTSGTAYRWSIYNMTGSYGNSLQFWDYDTISCSPGGMCSPRLTLMDSGNIGIGTTSPGAKLEIDGNVKLTAGSGASMTYADGTVQSTAWTGVLQGGDYAESVDVDGDRSKYEPGDVLVIDSKHPGHFLKSAVPYATDVTGIFATKPGVVGRRQGGPRNPDEVPMAMIGIVPTHVSAENGPIHAGDLLVTSSTLGYAMKATDRSRMPGAIVGKALGDLDSGRGVIEVVVTLQ